MSTQYDVGVTFQREDWEEKIYPQLKESFDGHEDRWLGTVDVDKIIGQADKIEADEFITLRWQDFPNWGSDSFTSEIEKYAEDDYDADYLCINNDNGYTKEVLNLGAGQFRLQSPAVRCQNEPYTEQSDRIITKLMQTCMEKGITLGKLKESLKGIADRDIIENFAHKAQEQSKEKLKETAR
jgi:hypothetical protein